MRLFYRSDTLHDDQTTVLSKQLRTAYTYLKLTQIAKAKRDRTAIIHFA